MNFLQNTPNQILHMLSTLILWSKTLYTTSGQYPTLYDFLAITQDELFLWENHLDNPNACMGETKTFLTYTPTSTLVLRGDVVEKP